MRIYQLQNFDGIQSFHRSFEHARSRISELDPSSKRKSTMQTTKETGRTIFSNGWEIFAIDLKTDKEGILNELNGVVRHVRLTASNTVVEAPKQSDPVVPPIPKIEDQEKYEDEILDYEQGITDEPPTLNGGSFSPPISYPGYPENCKGTCVHCKKEVGWLLHVG